MTPSRPVPEMIRPPELSTDAPHGPTASPGRDIWRTFRAAARGDVDSLREMLTKDRTLVRAEFAYTRPIELAVREGRSAAVELLIEAGADPARVDLAGDELITTARDRGHDGVAELLERRRDRSRVPGDREHVIHVAADAGDGPGLRALLTSEPELLERRDGAGATPLHRAVISGRQETVEALLDAGADIHARHGSGAGGSAGYPPVDFEPIDLVLWGGPHWSVRRDPGLAALLLEHGAALDPAIAAGLGDRDALESLLAEAPDDVDRPRPHGKRPLSTAIQFGHHAIAHRLLDLGADPSLPEGDIAPHGSSLYAAAASGATELVERLLEAGADPNGGIDSSGSATYAAATPEIRARLEAHGGHLDPYDLVWLGEDEEALRHVREDPSTADAGCGGVLAAASARGEIDLLGRLLAAGARVPETLTHCRSYLWTSPDSLRTLLDAGLDPDLPDWQAATPLHDLCSRDARGRPRPDRIECAELLRAAGADLEARDAHYRSRPLAWAARCGLGDMVEWLLANGAAVAHPEDEAWARPLAWAERRGHRSVADRLRRAAG